MREIGCDVLVIGSGLAGCRAAVEAAATEPGIRVVMVAPTRYGGCGWETHGVNAAVGLDDSWELHYADTMRAGAYLNVPLLAEVMCRNIASEVARFTAWNVELDAEAGRLSVGTYGGVSKSRSLHARDVTGLVLMHALTLEAIRAGITILPRYSLVDLLTTEGSCSGAVLIDVSTRELVAYSSPSTVLATGGGACMYPARSIADDKMGTGIAVALRRGATLVDMEMVQFHPTGLSRPGRPGHGALLEEELRAMGAVLRNRSGHAFLQDYDERGEMATRDVVSRAMADEVRAGRGWEDGSLALDLRGLQPGEIQNRFPNMLRRLREYGVDLMVERVVPVCPSAHFLMGGVKVDEHCHTEMPGLLCCGEDAGGVHGGNRLGGNGVAEALVFGAIAGREAALTARDGSPRKLRHCEDIILYTADESKALAELERTRNAMWQGCGVLRSADSLSRTKGVLADVRRGLGGERRTVRLATSVEGLGDEHVAGLRLGNVLDVSESISKAASWRVVSAGAHERVDSAAESIAGNSQIRWSADGPLDALR